MIPGSQARTSFDAPDHHRPYAGAMPMDTTHFLEEMRRMNEERMAAAERIADALYHAGRDHADPIWRMPFWEPYEALIEPAIADLDNAPSGGFAGAITAALFLRRFVPREIAWAHLDVFAWRPVAKPGRPKGGVGQGMRAILHALPAIA